MVRGSTRDIGKTLLPLVLLALLAQAMAPAMAVVRGGQAISAFDLGSICRVKADDDGGPLRQGTAHGEACPLCSLRIDVALQAPQTVEVLRPTPVSDGPRLHPAYRLAEPRAPPPDPLQPRAPPIAS
jgi:hypothetical protein